MFREKHLYGIGKVGEKGQIVIPAKARENLKIKTGDEFVFFGHGQMIHMIRAQELDEFFDRITRKITHASDKLAQKVSGIKAKLRKDLDK